MISLRKITLENRREMFNLAVSEEQRRFVASNLSSVASCYVLSVNGGHPYPWCIYADGQMIGFVLIVYGITGYEMPEIADGNYCILRFMIDHKYQGKGYGREALHEVLKYIRSFPAGPAQCCWISYEPDNYVAKGLYESVGFTEIGELIHTKSENHREKIAMITL